VSGNEQGAERGNAASATPEQREQASRDGQSYNSVRYQQRAPDACRASGVIAHGHPVPPHPEVTRQR
jgi:hypothetical protein